MAGALRELLAIFTVEADTKPLDQAGKKMEAFADTARSVATTLIAAFGVKAIIGFVEGQVEAATTLAHTAEMLGMTTEQMERFNYAASTMGISSEEASNSLRFLNRNIGEAATKGGDGAAAFQKLGVHLKDASGNIRPTSDVLAEVADGFAKLPSPAVKTATAMQLFGRAGARMIPFLNQGSAGVAQLNAEFDALGGGMSKDFINASLKTEHEIARLKLAGQGLTASIANALLPAFTWVIDKVTAAVSWLRQLNEHSDYLQNTLGALGAVLLVVAGYWALVNIGMIAAVAGFIVAAVVIDDVVTAAKGGKSVFGDWLDGILGLGATQAIFQQLGTWVDEARIQFSLFADEMGALGGAASDMANDVAHALKLKSDPEYEATKAQNAADADKRHLHTNQLDDQWNADQAKPSVFDQIDANENAYAQSKDPNGGPNLSKQKWWDMTNHNGTGPGGFNPMVPQIGPPAPSQAGPVTNHVTQNANVTVNAPSANDPKAIARATVDATRKALTDTHEDAFQALPTGGGH